MSNVLLSSQKEITLQCPGANFHFLGTFKCGRCVQCYIVESGGNYSPAANFLTRTTSTWGCTQHNATNNSTQHNAQHDAHNTMPQPYNSVVLQHHTMPNQTVPFNSMPYQTIPFNTMLQNTTPYHGAIRQGEAYKTSLYFWYFSQFPSRCSSQRGGGGLEVFTPPLLQSIHTVSILLIDRFYTFLLYFLYFLLYFLFFFILCYTFYTFIL